MNRVMEFLEDWLPLMAGFAGVVVPVDDARTDDEPAGAEFRCPLLSDGSGHCRLFEPASRPVPGPGGSSAAFRITCRYLVLDDAPADNLARRCQLGDAKSRRDHLA